ncbi:hypothetical protein F5Y16DRAFT_423041 [Xylariaceae sp. FL0255]|nr:hypothetical protein F5Y16DRAFT_423041 [Xylariaceae sp. FL0255]
MALLRGILFVASLALGSTANCFGSAAIIVQHPSGNLPRSYLTGIDDTALGFTYSTGGQLASPKSCLHSITATIPFAVLLSGTRLDGNVCVGDHPPLCAGRLEFNGKQCVDKTPAVCPLEAKFNGVVCNDVRDPVCKPNFEFKRASACQS